MRSQYVLAAQRRLQVPFVIYKRVIYRIWYRFVEDAQSILIAQPSVLGTVFKNFDRGREQKQHC